VIGSLVSREAFRAIARNKLRSALTVLGISIGIGAVICVFAIGNAGKQQLDEAFNNLGENLIWVEAGGRTVNGVRTGSGGTKSLTVADANAILAEIPLIRKVSPQVDGSVQLVYGNLNWGTGYRGESPEYIEVRRWALASGSNISQDDVDRADEVCVLADTVKQQLFPGGEDPVGKVIKVRDFPCKVIGVLAPKGTDVGGHDQDNFILLPYTTAQKKIAGITWLRDIMCSAVSPEAIPLARDQIVGLLRERHRIRADQPDDFNMRMPEDQIKARMEANQTFALLLIAIASVSLLVGGIGIMNVMLVSVTERTREIGVRMAVGATEANVRLQFLGEAVALSLLGAVIGTIIGLAGSYGIGAILDWPMSISVQSVLIASSFAIATGVLFGYYPAHKAAALDPIVALRFE
jgi:putative ABC transport system permease protein